MFQIEIEKKNFFIYKIDPRTKIFLLLSFGIIAVSLDEPKSLLCTFSFSLFLFLSARLNLKKYKIVLPLLLFGVWGIVTSQGIFYNRCPKTIIFTIVPKEFPIIGSFTGGIYLFKEGLIYGVVQGLRFATVLLLGLFVAWTTDPKEFLLGLTKLKVPYSISFMFMTAVRFVPIIISEILNVVAAQKLRGENPKKLGIHTIRTCFNILLPVAANSVRRAANLAISCESRGFDPRSKRTYIKEIEFKKSDLFISTFSISLAFAILFAKILFWLYNLDLLYLCNLRWIYDLASKL